MPKYDGAPIIAAAVKKVRDSLTPSTQVAIQAHSQVIDFGPTNLNITLQRFDNCTSGGPLGNFPAKIILIIFFLIYIIFF